MKKKNNDLENIHFEILKLITLNKNITCEKINNLEVQDINNLEIIDINNLDKNIEIRDKNIEITDNKMKYLLFNNYLKILQTHKYDDYQYNQINKLLDYLLKIADNKDYINKYNENDELYIDLITELL